jgi:hypothetical protein
VRLPDEDTFYGRESEATKNRLYGAGHTADFDRRVFRRIVRDFDLDPQARMTLFVEGDTELGFYRRLAERSHIDLERSGIELMSLNGVGGLKSDRLQELLDRLRREEVFVYVIVDHDRGGDHVRQFRTYARNGLVAAGSKVWNPDFEESSSAFEELAEIASAVARRDGVAFTISPGDLKEAARTTAVGNAIKRLSERHKFYSGKGIRWGEALADWAFDHPTPPHLPGAEQRPAVAVLDTLLRGQGSSYHISMMLERVGDDGALQPRRVPVRPAVS